MTQIIKKTAILIAAVLLSCTDLWAGDSGECGNKLTWTLDVNGVLTISGTGKMYDYDFSFYPSPWMKNSSIKKIVIKDGVTSIGNFAFHGCSGLTSVTIPNSVISIGNYAFEGCSGLTSVTIPNSVISIENYTFYGCSGLTSVTIPNSVTSIGIYAFEGCSGLTSVTIPNSVTSIGNYAFLGCSGLTSATIPNSVTSIGNYTFYGCSGLTSVTIPNSVTSIGNYTFYGCSGLTSVTIPNSVTSIGNSAFEGCSGLTSVTIPNSVTSIGNYAFRDCSGLTMISVSAKTPPICGNNVFDGVDKQKCELAVPQESLEAYKSADTWKDFQNITTSGIEGIEADEVKVTVANGEISINGVADNAEVEIYGANGVMIYRGTNKTIAMPSPGIYIVRVAGKNIKIAF